MRGARHRSAEGATGGARVSAGGARWLTVESQAKRGARDSARSEASNLKKRRAAKRTTGNLVSLENFRVVQSARFVDVPRAVFATVVVRMRDASGARAYLETALQASLARVARVLGFVCEPSQQHT